MPRRYRKRVRSRVNQRTTRTTRKFRRSSRRYRKARTFRPKWIPAVSQKASVKFVYCDSTFSRILNTTGGYSAYYVFRGNSPYDPDYTGIGVQPYGWDDYVGVNKFINFVCPASSIRVYFRPEATYADIRRLHVSVIPSRGYNPTMTDISDVRMMPFRKSTTYDGSTESTRGAQISNYCSTKRLINLSSNDGACEGSYAGNPASNGAWYWIVHFYTDVYIDEEVDIFFDVKIKYYTRLNRTNPPDES